MDPGAAKSSIGLSSPEGNAVGGRRTMMDGVRRRVRRSESLGCRAVGLERSERLRGMS